MSFGLFHRDVAIEYSKDVSSTEIFLIMSFQEVSVSFTVSVDSMVVLISIMAAQ